MIYANHALGQGAVGTSLSSLGSHQYIGIGARKASLFKIGEGPQVYLDVPEKNWSRDSHERYIELPKLPCHQCWFLRELDLGQYVEMYLQPMGPNLILLSINILSINVQQLYKK